MGYCVFFLKLSWETSRHENKQYPVHRALPMYMESSRKGIFHLYLEKKGEKEIQVRAGEGSCTGQAEGETHMHGSSTFTEEGRHMGRRDSCTGRLSKDLANGHGRLCEVHSSQELTVFTSLSRDVSCSHLEHSPSTGS